MKKRQKIVISMITIVAILFVILPQNVLARENITVETQATSDKTDAVLVYYDIATKTETFFTAEDLEKTISSSGVRNSTNVVSEPQNPTEPITQKQLTNKEIEEHKDAEKNTMEYYGGDIASTYAVDNRKIVSNPQADPYYRIAKVFYSKGLNAAGTSRGAYVGTGFAVGYNLCATARHCVTDDYGNWVTDFKAYYGYNGENNTYRNLLTDVAGFVSYPHYITGTNADGTITTDYNYDIAFVVWKENTVYQTGCLGMTAAISNGMSLRTAGYPGDLNSGYRMYEAYGTVTSFDDYRLNCDDIYGYRGQSGSPYFDSEYYAHGVLTHILVDANNNVLGESSGRRFSTALIQWLKANGYV